VSALALVSLAVAACGGSSPLGGGGGGDPAAVVQDAVAKAAAKDVAGLGSLACAGQADKLQQELGMSGDALGADALPGLDTKALLDSIKLDTSGVKVGTPSITGDVAQVPVSGSMSVTFDKDKMKAVLKQVMQQQGTDMTDEQLDGLLTSMGAATQSVPVDESVRLVKEGGAWKICEDLGASPSP
jgi:hypothetical protein